MSDIERITVTITAEMARVVKSAVSAGDYATSSEIIREALRDWRHKRTLRAQQLTELRADIAEGLDDIAAGRVSDFDADQIIKEGKERLRARKSSA